MPRSFESTTKLCSLLLDKNDPRVKLGTIDRQHCEQLMNTILEPIVEVNNCDYGELAEMIYKLGGFVTQVFDIAYKQDLAKAIEYAQGIRHETEEFISNKLVSECGCRSAKGKE